MSQDHIANIRPKQSAYKWPRVEIAVVAGHGKTQRQSYVWIGEAENGPAYAFLDRREMRKLRDALNVALGEHQ